ncbi:hypothetical protein LV716_17340 [Flagellimonas sp. HMM57]|uniref:hypothetical protein n=1 Tax=unclassified Flagellimonas TaxID=2644544 RepID=UPI0013D085F7|nr:MULTISPECIES: hypothetical protein [unclassified Flagellimonas]UII76007.1 hypothetical protein LV716_17340 [Flagellimonas sp. HMM57]
MSGKTYLKTQKIGGGRFSYKIAIDQNANVISVNSEPIDTDIRDNIDDQVDQNLNKFSETKSHPHIFFEVQTFDLNTDSKNNKLIKTICRIHDIVSSIKKEKISNGFDKELVDRVLLERYVVYDYKQLYGNENPIFSEKQEN